MGSHPSSLHRYVSLALENGFALGGLKEVSLNDGIVKVRAAGACNAENVLVHCDPGRGAGGTVH